MKNIVYCLRHKKDGYLMTVSEHSNNGQHNCNNTTVQFDRHGSKIYETNDILNAIKSLVLDMPWYNSTHDRPSTDGVDNMSEFEIVKIRKIIETEPVNIKLPRNINEVLEYICSPLHIEKQRYPEVSHKIQIKETASIRVGDKFIRDYDDALEVVVIDSDGKFALLKNTEIAIPNNE